MFAPYQVVLEDDRSLIYVPEDDDRYAREPTAQDLHILGRPMPLPRRPSMPQHTRCPRVADLTTSAAKGPCCTVPELPQGRVSL